MPFGKADVTIATVENNLRFAGQYYDSETGLHYNGWRYYDPHLGRYLRADPIGLRGGSNLYGYVGDNPLKFVDITGLEKCITWNTHNYKWDVKTFYTPWKLTKKCRVTTLKLSLGIDLIVFDVRDYLVKERRVRMEWDTIKTTTKHKLCISTCPMGVTYKEEPLGQEIVGYDSKTLKEEFWDLIHREWLKGPDSTQFTNYFSIGGGQSCQSI